MAEPTNRFYVPVLIETDTIEHATLVALNHLVVASSTALDDDGEEFEYKTSAERAVEETP